MPRGFALFVCGMGTVLILVGLYLSRVGREARRFAHTRGRVLVAEVEELRLPTEQGEPRFRAVVRYSYEAQGRTFESDRITVAGPGRFEDADREEVQRFVEQHPPGGEIDVWFDPANPHRSALVRDVPHAAVALVVAIGLALIGIGIFGLARSPAGRAFGA